MTTSTYTVVTTPAGPIAAAAGLGPMKHKATSLLTSALGEKSPAMPIHPFLSSNSLGAPCPTCTPQGDAQLEQVLDKWDRAWMGSVSDTHLSNVSPSPSTAGTSPRQADQTAHGMERPAANGSALLLMPGASSPLGIGGSPLGKLSSSARDSPAPPLLPTPPPAHRPLRGLDAGKDSPTHSAQQAAEMDEQDDGHEPSPAAAAAAGQSGTVASSVARPISMQQHPRHVVPKGAKGPNDFASVFFSPLPYSYLNMSRSDSTDHLLNSVGSPDITLRNGRLAATTSITHVEWPVDGATISPELSSLTPMDSADQQPALEGGLHSIKEDVTAHGSKLRTGSSSSGTSSGLTLVQEALAQASMQEGQQGSDGRAANGEAKPHSTGVSPDAMVSDSTVGGGSPRSAGLSTSDGPPVVHTNSTTVRQTTVSSGGTTVVRTVHLNTTSLGSEPSILIRPGSGLPRPHSPPCPQFAQHHPAVAPMMAVAMSPLPGLPGPDLIKATGYQSIAAALESQTQCTQPLRLVAAAAMIPHVDKADKGGEDAYCIVDVGLGAIGVADGVSGWAEEGIDPAEYSRTLMRHCSEALQEAGVSADPREVIRYAHQSTVMPGSSTVCLGVMQPCGRLQVANLGDSGVRVIRDGRIVFATSAQQHMFNMPYQLSHPSIIDSPDDADSAEVTTIDVLPGDVIVMATDGLYDNMFDDEIAAICYDMVSRRRRALLLGNGGDAPPSPKDGVTAATIDSLLYTAQEAEALAVQITRTAHRYAQNPYQRTPWSVASCEQGYGWARYFAKGGGKMDDCTVIVSFVQPDRSAAKQ